MMRGDLTGAIAQYDQMERSLDQLDGDPQGLRAICKALKSEVYYEMNKMGDAQSLLTDALTSIEQTDAWLDVLAATYRCLLYTSPSPRDRTRSRMPSSA